MLHTLYIAMGLLWKSMLIHSGKVKNLEGPLFDYLFSVEANYNKLVRPVEEQTESVKVHVSYHLQQLVDLVDKEQMFAAIGYFTVTWEDSRLSWNVTEYPSKSIVIPRDKVWIPDVWIRESRNGAYGISKDPHYWVEVNAAGSMLWYPAGEIQIGCFVDMRYFPFDDQLCTLKISSWQYADQKELLVLKGAGSYLRESAIHNHWMFVNTTAVSSVFQMIIFDLLPRTSQSLPYLTYFIFTQMALIGISIAIDVSIIHAPLKRTTKLPKMLLRIALWAHPHHERELKHKDALTDLRKRLIALSEAALNNENNEVLNSRVVDVSLNMTRLRLEGKLHQANDHLNSRAWKTIASLANTVYAGIYICEVVIANVILLTLLQKDSGFVLPTVAEPCYRVSY